MTKIQLFEEVLNEGLFGPNVPGERPEWDIKDPNNKKVKDDLPKSKAKQIVDQNPGYTMGVNL